MYELWIMIVGGDNDEERIIYNGSNKFDLEQAVLETSSEVETNIDKYYELITPDINLTFNSYYDFIFDITAYL